MEQPFITPHPKAETLSLIEARTFQTNEIAQQYTVPVGQIGMLEASPARPMHWVLNLPLGRP